MSSIKNLTIGQFSLDLDRSIYDRLISKYEDLTEFIHRLQSFITNLESHKNEYNINPSADKIKSGIYILGKDDSELGIFPDSHLALKCSKKKPLAEDLKKQFNRSIEITQNFRKQFNDDQKALLQICLVYLYAEISSPSFSFKQILFMQRVKGEKILGNTKLGFSPKFCEVFNIPSLEEISTFTIGQRFKPT